MVSFAILLFFAATGLTLNHQEALIGAPRTLHLTGTIPAALLAARPGAEVAREPIAAALRSAHGIKADLSDFRVDDDQVSISFKGPGYEADAFIDRRTGAYEMNESRFGVVAIINDLHKGRDTGTAWAGIIDVSAVLMVLVSLTGLVLIFFIHKRLVSGLVSLAFGALVCVLVYFFLVS